jgi:hypothetical protein
LSLPVKSNVADVLFVLDPSAGPDVIVVSGAVVSIVHSKCPGVGSVLPAESVASTSNV